MIIDSDTCQRANQSGLGTASSGSTYTISGASATLQISSNEAEVTSETGFGYAILGTHNVATLNFLGRFEQDGLFQGIGPAFRYTDANNNYFVALYSGQIQLYKMVSGGFTEIAGVAKSLTAGNYYWIRVIASGTTIQVRTWADGSGEPSTWDLNLTDSTWTTGGFGTSWNSQGNPARWDSLTITDNQGTLSLITQAQTVFKIRAVQTSQARSTFKIRAQLITQAQSHFLIPLQALQVPLHALFAVIQKLAAKFTEVQKLAARFTTAGKLSASFRSHPLAQPNSTIQSSATVTDNTGALISNLSVLAVTITFPDESTQSLSLTSGVTNVGNGVYSITYQTKTPGLIKEEWKATAVDGVTTLDVINLVPVSY